MLPTESPLHPTFDTENFVFNNYLRQVQHLTHIIFTPLAGLSCFENDGDPEASYRKTSELGPRINQGNTWE